MTLLANWTSFTNLWGKPLTVHGVQTFSNLYPLNLMHNVSCDYQVVLIEEVETLDGEVEQKNVEQLKAIQTIVESKVNV